MAELLVRAQGHWLDSLTPNEIAALPDWRKKEYTYRSKKGDIIVVRPDGWTWGREECLPRFIVIKIPGLSVEDAKKYEEPLLITPAAGAVRAEYKGRKYALPESLILSAVSLNKNVHSFNKSAFLSTVLTRTVK